MPVRGKQNQAQEARRRHPATGAPAVPRSTGHAAPRLPAPPLRALPRRQAAVGAVPRATSSMAVVVLVGAVATLVALGLVMVLSAGSVASQQTYGWSYHYVAWQAPTAVLGSLVAWRISRVDYRKFRKLAGPLMFVAIVLLFLVLIPGLGWGVYGSRRWIGPDFARVQPSEFAKLALALYGAHVTAMRLGSRDGLLVGPALAALGAAGALVMWEPDLGTTVVLAAVAFAIVVAAGASRKAVLGMAALGLAAVSLLALTASYRRARLFGFLDPFSDASSSGYQLVQSFLGLGSGGVFGVGLGGSRQKWSFLPNAHTDFIFAVIGEEMGLIGTFIVLTMFAAVIWAGLRIAKRAPDAFGTLLAVGITAWLGAQALINMGTVTGLVPVTGIPLPFVSYGLSQLITALLGVGVLVSIGRASAVRRR